MAVATIDLAQVAEASWRKTLSHKLSISGTVNAVDFVVESAPSEFGYRLHTPPPGAVNSYDFVFVPENAAWAPIFVQVKAGFRPRVDIESDTGAAQDRPEQEFRSLELAWLEANRAELAARYAGEWVAIDGSQLLAHAGDLPEVVRLASENGCSHPFIAAVPAGPIRSLHL